jgi:hypothetical protein
VESRENVIRRGEKKGASDAPEGSPGSAPRLERRDTGIRREEGDGRLQRTGGKEKGRLKKEETKKGAPVALAAPTPRLEQ